MLSGTFMPNTWDQVHGLLRLIPGVPIDRKIDFDKNFTGIHGHPTVSKRARLIKLLEGVVIARPATVLELPGVTILKCEFAIDAEAGANELDFVKKHTLASRTMAKKRGERQSMAVLANAL